MGSFARALALVGLCGCFSKPPPPSGVPSDAPPASFDDGGDDRNNSPTLFCGAPDGPVCSTGDNFIEGPDDGHAAGLAEASSAYALVSADVTHVYAYFEGENTAPSHTVKTLEIALYHNGSDDNPGDLIGAGYVGASGGSALPPGWQTATLQGPGPFHVDAGQIYWIALLWPGTEPTGGGETITFPYRYLGAGGTGACTPTMTTPCTVHSSDGLASLPAVWDDTTTGDRFLPSQNSFFAGP